MYLAIDVGNTRLKAAVFDKDELRFFRAFDSTDDLLAASLHEHFEISHAIIGTVVNDIGALTTGLGKHCSILLFSADTQVPLHNLYATAHTLGSDRLAAAVGAATLRQHSNLLVIDAGTCIKYNFVTAAGEYLGGAISPGLHMRLRALHEFTSRLPMVNLARDYDRLVGTSTAESILSGVMLGAAAEVDGTIEAYQQKFPGLVVYLTGGDAEYLAARVKKPIFADQFLVLRGLNAILRHNISE